VKPGAPGPTPEARSHRRRGRACHDRVVVDVLDPRSGRLFLVSLRHFVAVARGSVGVQVPGRA
jgi:hypothetical protein